MWNDRELPPQVNNGKSVTRTVNIPTSAFNKNRDSVVGAIQILKTVSSSVNMNQNVHRKSNSYNAVLSVIYSEHIAISHLKLE